ncbi:MAG: DUF4242 domain-containing protein [Gaiellales bacterium]
MPQFLIELYVPRGDGETVARSARLARLAAVELTREGRAVRVVRSIFVPDDETCFLLYEAITADDVAEAARRASLPFDRVALAVAGREGEEESS